MCVSMHPQAHRPVTRGLTQYSPLFPLYSSLILVGGCSAFPYLKVQLTIGCRRQGTAGGAGRGWQGVSCIACSDLKKFLSQVWFPPSEHFSSFYCSFCGRKMPFPRSLNQLFDSSALQAWRIWENNTYQGMAALFKFPSWSVLLWQCLLCLWQVPTGTSPAGIDKCQSVASVYLWSQIWADRRSSAVLRSALQRQEDLKAWVGGFLESLKP